MTKKARSNAEANGRGATLPLQVAHRIEVLLHTMRLIERHEEQLCVVMTEIRNEGAVSAGTRRELEELLEELPSDAYQTDLDAVGAALAAATSAKQDEAGGRRRKEPVTKRNGSAK